MGANHRELPAGEWAQARRKILRPGVICWICRRPIDLGAPPRTARSPSVDHVLPLATLRELPRATRRRLSLDPAYLRPAHYGCNSRRGARRPPTERKVTSREW